jgi:hypothetical protein
MTRSFQDSEAGSISFREVEMTTPDELEEAVARTISECEGNAVAAVRVLLVANAYLEAEVERLAEAVSKGYARGRLRPGTMQEPDWPDRVKR